MISSSSEEARLVTITAIEAEIVKLTLAIDRLKRLRAKVIEEKDATIRELNLKMENLGQQRADIARKIVDEEGPAHAE